MELGDLFEECKALEKKAKELEKEDPTEAVKMYEQAADCYNKNNRPKDGNSCLEKVAKLLRDSVKLNEDPVAALKVYKKASEIYNQIDKQSESEKVMKEAYNKFIESAKNLRAEAKKIEDPDSAEEKLEKASGYASKGKDEELSKACWIDSGHQFRKKAAGIEDPREALEAYKHAVQNYEKGENRELEYKTLIEAAEKFNKKAVAIEKTKKDMVLAIDNYVQTGTLYRAAENEEKADTLDTKVEELCELIGLPLAYITEYLESINITAISLEKIEAVEKINETPTQQKKKQTKPIAAKTPKKRRRG